MERPLTPEEAALWARVLETVRPIRAVAKLPASSVAALPAKGVAPPAKTAKAARPLTTKADATGTISPRRVPDSRQARPVAKEAATLDGSWDRQLARGAVSPDYTIDLHGANLGSAYDLLDTALARSVAAGDRVVLLITGKPPRAASERPHARGAIRAAVGDWLASSRHAAAIAAVRGAHPRHGGAGALYIVLRRPRFAPDFPTRSRS